MEGNGVVERAGPGTHTSTARLWTSSVNCPLLPHNGGCKLPGAAPDGTNYKTFVRKWDVPWASNKQPQLDNLRAGEETRRNARRNAGKASSWQSQAACARKGQPAV